MSLNLKTEDKLISTNSNYSSNELLSVLGSELEKNFYLIHNFLQLEDNNSVEIPHPTIYTNKDNTKLINLNENNNSIKNEKLHMFTIIKLSNNNLQENSNNLINKTNYLKSINKELRLIKKNDGKEVKSIEIKRILEKRLRRGRRKLGEKEERTHNKRSKDNIMRTIKVYFRRFLYSLIKINCKNYEDLKKIDSKFNQSLKKDYNIKLFNSTLKDIFQNTKISIKYRHYPQDSNKKLINKIYKDNKEKALIKILNLKYKEVFEIFIRNITKDKKLNPELEKKIKGTHSLENRELKDINELINTKEKESKNNGDNQEIIDNYKQDIKNLCLDYIGWFDRKIGRVGRERLKKEN